MEEEILLINFPPSCPDCGHELSLIEDGRYMCLNIECDNMEIMSSKITKETK